MIACSVINQAKQLKKKGKYNKLIVVSNKVDTVACYYLIKYMHCG